MSKRFIFRSVGIALLVVMAGTLYYVQQVMAIPPLPAYNTNVISGKPEGAACINKAGVPGIAIELIDLAQDKVYLSGGSNGITEAEWDETNVFFPYLKNSKRYLLFDKTCLYRSPGKPVDCQGDECVAYVELYGHTWFVLNDLSGQACYPDASGCNANVVNPGYVSITTIDKCQELTFSGPVIYQLVDDRGNHYVMHATADGLPSVEGVTLPDGWILSQKTINEPLTIQPRGEGHCYFNIIRDNTLQSYHQYIFMDEVFPPE